MTICFRPTCRGQWPGARPRRARAQARQGHAFEIWAFEIWAFEIWAFEIWADEIEAPEIWVPEIWVPEIWAHRKQALEDIAPDEAEQAMALSLIERIHHAAYRCRDAEQTRWFYEDVLGLRYRAALAFDDISGTDIKREYMHLFFEMSEGSCVAFFDDPYTATAAQFDQKDSFDVHIAFEIASMADLERWKQKIRDARIKCYGPIDHGFVHSIYFYDPNGYQCEITCRTPEYLKIMDAEEADARKVTQEWCQRTRAIKEQRFGAQTLDQREVPAFRSAR